MEPGELNESLRGHCTVVRIRNGSCALLLIVTDMGDMGLLQRPGGILLEAKGDGGQLGWLVRRGHESPRLSRRDGGTFVLSRACSDSAEILDGELIRLLYPLRYAARDASCKICRWCSSSPRYGYFAAINV